MNHKKRILITPLNWGLGHATRCIPIVDFLLEKGTEVLLASDGRALDLLKKEYPQVPTFELPAYNVHYRGSSMVWNIARQLPKISHAIFKEKKAIKKLVEQEQIDVIISDNRYGCRDNRCTNIFISHQINIAIPNRRLEIITNKINQQFINRFDQCWIPDFEGPRNLAGKLSASEHYHYIGPLSRFKKYECPQKYELIAVLSGPEPQRSRLEAIIISQLKALHIKALIVQGKTEVFEKKMLSENIKQVSFMTSSQLNEAMLSSEVVLARSGYSTIMDLARLELPAILIPTPGQTEQEYLAERLLAKQIFFYQKQSTINLSEALKKATQFKGFSHTNPPKQLLQKTLNDLCNL